MTEQVKCRGRPCAMEGALWPFIVLVALFVSCVSLADLDDDLKEVKAKVEAIQAAVGDGRGNE